MPTEDGILMGLTETSDEHPDRWLLQPFTTDERAVLKGICIHYLMATAWAERPGEVEAGTDVKARRALCERIVAVAHV